jgi:hypothetical protein
MIITLLLIALFLSFSIHIIALINFVTKKSDTAIKVFVSTTMSNVMIAGTCIVVIISRPEILREVDVIKVAWILSGIIMFVALAVQIRVFIKIYKRSKDPANYHVNYFGKKVLHSTVVSKFDMMIFFGAMPFLLIAGAYFIAKLINYLR